MSQLHLADRQMWTRSSPNAPPALASPRTSATTLKTCLTVRVLTDFEATQKQTKHVITHQLSE